MGRSRCSPLSGPDPTVPNRALPAIQGRPSAHKRCAIRIAASSSRDTGSLKSRFGSWRFQHPTAEAARHTRFDVWRRRSRQRHTRFQVASTTLQRTTGNRSRDDDGRDQSPIPTPPIETTIEPKIELGRRGLGGLGLAAAAAATIGTAAIGTVGHPPRRGGLLHCFTPSDWFESNDWGPLAASRIKRPGSRIDSRRSSYETAPLVREDGSRAKSLLNNLARLRDIGRFQERRIKHGDTEDKEKKIPMSISAEFSSPCPPCLRVYSFFCPRDRSRGFAQGYLGYRARRLSLRRARLVPR